MSTLTGSQTRTITGHLTLMLEHPRWVIERDVDFSDCHSSGHYNTFLPECRDCRFGAACKWLNKHPDVDISSANVAELVNALQSSVHYITEEKTRDHGSGCDCESCEWLHAARRLLHNLPKKT